MEINAQTNKREKKEKKDPLAHVRQFMENIGKGKLFQEYLTKGTPITPGEAFFG